MMRVILALSAVVLIAVAQETVTMKQCQDGQCTTGCQSQSFTAGQCLNEENTADTVELTCYSGPSMCNDMKIYEDSACQDESTMTLASNVCNSCQSNFTASCGALHGAIFVAVNCTDAACQDCGGAIIVPFKKCTHVAPLGYLMITAVTSCSVVSLTTYNESGCTGGKFTQQYQNGKCFGGSIFQCN